MLEHIIFGNPDDISQIKLKHNKNCRPVINDINEFYVKFHVIVSYLIF